MALCRMPFLALCSYALGAEVQQLAGSDEFSALQLEMKVQANELKRVDEIDSTQSQSSSLSCPNMPGNIMDGNECVARKESAAQAPMQTPTAPDAWKEAVAVPPPSADTASTAVDDEAAAPFFLRYMLQLLVVFVIADGLRRSRQTNTAVTKCAPVESTKPATAEGRAELFKAVQAGDAKACKALLMQGVPVTGEDHSGGTLLHAAVKTGSASVVALLLQKGAKVNAVDAWDDTALHLAAMSNAEELCNLLIKHGAKVDALNAQEWTPLVVAGSAGKRAVCEFLLARGATQGDVPESSLPPMLRLLLQGEEPEAPEPEVIEKQSFDVFAM